MAQPVTTPAKRTSSNPAESSEMLKPVAMGESVPPVHGLENEPHVRLLWTRGIAEVSVKLLKEKVPQEITGEFLRRMSAAMRGVVGLRWVRGVQGQDMNSGGSVGGVVKAGGVPEAAVRSFVDLVGSGLRGVEWVAARRGGAATEVCLLFSSSSFYRLPYMCFALVLLSSYRLGTISMCLVSTISTLFQTLFLGAGYHFPCCNRAVSALLC